jgi:gluconate 2-dehydrogenase gamma chain
MATERTCECPVNIEVENIDMMRASKQLRLAFKFWLSEDRVTVNSTRRDWLFGALGSVAFTAIATAQEHAHRTAKAEIPVPFEFFTPAEAADVAAMAAQILPSDDSPGAKEAGVIYFIDRALATFYADQQEIYRKGMPDVKGIAGRPKDQQFQLVRSIEKSEFFETVRMHTMVGFLGSPAYGGNRNQVGWTHIHFEDRMGWAPPFGYYDAEPQ